MKSAGKAKQTCLRRICFALPVPSAPYRLTPMACNPKPTAWTLRPMTRNPSGYRTRRPPIAAGNPDISVTIPSPMARDPDVSTAGWWAGRFSNDGRRPNAGIGSGFRFLRIEKTSDSERQQSSVYGPRPG
jgi:hypothetical protein